MQAIATRDPACGLLSAIPYRSNVPGDALKRNVLPKVTNDELISTRWSHRRHFSVCCQEVVHKRYVNIALTQYIAICSGLTKVTSMGPHAYPTPVRLALRNFCPMVIVEKIVVPAAAHVSADVMQLYSAQSSQFAASLTMPCRFILAASRARLWSTTYWDLCTPMDRYDPNWRAVEPTTSCLPFVALVMRTSGQREFQQPICGPLRAH